MVTRRTTAWWVADASNDICRVPGRHSGWPRIFHRDRAASPVRREGRLRRILRDNGLSIVFGLLFLGALIGQAIAGHADFNDQQIANGGQPKSLPQFIASSDFVTDVAENWQSEYLQFFLFIFATVWLMQRGSPESKMPNELGGETDERQQLGRHTTARSPKWARVGGWRTAVFSNSLGLVMAGLFLLSWLAQSVAGVVSYNADQLANQEDPVSW